MYLCAELSFGSAQKQRDIGQKQVSLVTFIFFFGYAGSSLLHGLFPSCSKQGLPSTSPVAEHRLWCARASEVAAPSSVQHTGSLLVARGLQFSVASGTFPDQGSNLSLLHWQTDSLPLSHQGSPSHEFYENDPISAVLGVKQQ